MTNQQFKPLNVVTQLTLFTVTSVVLTSCTHLGYDQSQVNHTPSPTLDNTITLSQVSNDVAYLSSDAMQGRDNFSSEIHIAADYIAQRFSEVGLTPAPSAPNFKQNYTVQQIKPSSIEVKINGQIIKQNSLAMATTVAKVNWDTNSLAINSIPNTATVSASAVNLEIIGENVNMRKALSELNHQGGQHLVLLHPKHEKSFKRYQSYFANGLTSLVTKSAVKHNGVIIIALTDISKVKQLTVNAKATVKNTQLSNVVGILPGKSKANEIVLYSAHYDHLGVKESTPPVGAKQVTGDIFNGADDDASGVSAIINLANYFAKTDNNERTLMFTAFSAEEIGGFGSRYFSEQINPNKITAMINIEMIGKPSMFGEGSVWMTGMDRSNLGEQLNQTLAADHLKVYADPYPTENLFYRSDNATLARLGVPAHSFSSTQLDKDPHYHQATDDINSLNLPSMLTVIKTLALATTPLAKGTMTPLRIDATKVDNKGLIY
ncbi:M28 family metallopeptidase [Colwellia echini]|uniref:M20/M25/M40 family metallo-hydrolase n=1 Tax=Colwellia echini TaxID=1982103 RepID=A0ABY3MUP8_9GAMM|nr:M20/M25/M40 family metallo-hydrolase [Colwellia echini]TYK64923.1 M20/M25/M40 family metallo-hydrolase [Colwellia echini]